MNEKELTKKLHILRTVRPGGQTLSRIRKNVYQDVEVGWQPVVAQPSRWLAFFAVQHRLSFAVGSMVVLLVFAVLSVVLLPTQTHTLWVSSRIALAQNQYEKARIALADTTTRFGTGVVLQNPSDLSQSLALTNTELDRLHLKGETGKYSAQECHKIYEAYHAYLEKKEQEILATNNHSLAAQIHAYDEQAEKKLHMYPSL